MPALFIKNPKAAELADRIARIRGVSKTQAVTDALQAALNDIRPKERRPELLRWIEQRRARIPLEPTGKPSDKAFFDDLWGDA